jgi:large subunit ribosomal protein L35Ae
MVKGIVVQFRRGRKTIHERHFLLDIGLENRDSASKMAGKEVVWKSPAGKEIKGKINSAHGNKGLVRAIFEKGLPGQAITTDIEVRGDLPKVSEKKVDAKKEEKKNDKEVSKDNKEEEKDNKDSREKVEENVSDKKEEVKEKEDEGN